jgi:EAL domain-containing protein (putative c-di-GMP-specific phosphodiesterase class I)
VQNLNRSDGDRAFVHTLIDLARRLGLETVAEWVQDEEAAVMLAQWGCDYLQGILVGLASAERPWAELPEQRQYCFRYYCVGVAPTAASSFFHG